MAPRLALTCTSPTRLDIPAEVAERARPLLEVTDRSADFQLRRLRRSEHWQREKLGDQAFDQEKKRLQAKRDRSLLFQDERGWWAPSGLRAHLSDRLGLPVERSFALPEPSPLPWKTTPRELFGRDPYPHQEEGWWQIASQGHGALSLPCGVGKSLLLALTVRNIGLRAALLVSSRILADQLAALLLKLLGPKLVGVYNGDQKQVGKHVTVCSAMAVQNLKPGSAAYEHLAGCQLLLGDESHTFAAQVLEGLSAGLFAAAPYRGFTSATQMRTDGLDLVLRGVVGPTVAEMTFRQAVERGLLAEPSFTMTSVASRSSYHSRDMDRMTRAHLYENADLAALVGALAKKFKAMGYSCLFLVEEFPQAALLLPHLDRGARVLHGGTGDYQVQLLLQGGHSPKSAPTVRYRTDLGSLPAERILAGWRDPKGPKKVDFRTDLCAPESFLDIIDARVVEATGQALLPPEHRDSDVPELQAAFNDGALWDLVATSAGRVGVDLHPPRPLALFYLVGGTSEIAFVQGVGRGSRRPGKDHFLVLDFRVDALKTHADARAEIAARLFQRPKEVSEADIRRMLNLGDKP